MALLVLPWSAQSATACCILPLSSDTCHCYHLAVLETPLLCLNLPVGRYWQCGHCMLHCLFVVVWGFKFHSSISIVFPAELKGKKAKGENIETWHCSERRFWTLHLLLLFLSNFMKCEHSKLGEWGVGENDRLSSLLKLKSTGKNAGLCRCLCLCFLETWINRLEGQAA